MTADLLTSNEKIILFIIREYLDQNRIFRLKDIVPYINDRVAKLANPLNDYEIQMIEEVYNTKLYFETVFSVLSFTSAFSFTLYVPGLWFLDHFLGLMIVLISSSLPKSFKRS